MSDAIFMHQQTICVLLHMQVFRRVWDALTMILLLYLVFALGIIVAFDAQSGFQRNFFIFLDIWFALDVVLNCMTTFDNSNFELVTDSKLIVYHYARTWMFVDILSVFPFEYVIITGANPDLITAVRLVKLMKMFRVFRVNRLLDRLRIALDMKNKSIFLLKFAMFFIIVDHWLGCLYWMWSTVFDNMNSWVYYELEDFPDGPIYYMGSGTQYITTIFWAVQTITTMGYGNSALPTTQQEQLFVIGSMMMGAFFYSYCLTNMSRALFNHDQIAANFSQISDKLQDWFKMNRISQYKAFFSRVVTYMWFKNNSNIDLIPDDGILQRSSQILSRQINLELPYLLMTGVFNKNNPAFSNLLIFQFGLKFQVQMAQVLRGKAFSLRDLVMSPSSPKGLYILRNGMAVAISGSLQRESGPPKDEEEGFLLHSGHAWGERAIILDKPLDFTVVAKSLCEVYIMDALELKEMLLEYWPVEKATLFHAWQKTERKEFLTERLADTLFQKDFLTGQCAISTYLRDACNYYHKAYMSRLQNVYANNNSLQGSANPNLLELSKLYSGSYDRTPDTATHELSRSYSLQQRTDHTIQFQLHENSKNLSSNLEIDDGQEDSTVQSAEKAEESVEIIQRKKTGYDSETELLERGSLRNALTVPKPTPTSSKRTMVHPVRGALKGSPETSKSIELANYGTDKLNEPTYVSSQIQKNILAVGKDETQSPNITANILDTAKKDTISIQNCEALSVESTTVNKTNTRIARTLWMTLSAQHLSLVEELTNAMKGASSMQQQLIMEKQQHIMSRYKQEIGNLHINPTFPDLLF